ncbi:hypothetical protein KR054_006338 [Drosophila jambulina]|nr:hypothetical protein KR054_006338 [Drosophila jambulina]
MMKSRGLSLLSMSRAWQGATCAPLKPLRTQLHHNYPDNYPHLPQRDDLKPMKAPDRTKVYDACWQTMRRTEYKCRSDIEFNLPSFIAERKKCLEDPCAGDVQAWDLTHYKPQDMLNRKYPRTWSECKVKCRKRKMQCVSLPPDPPRRKRTVMKSPCPEDLCVLGRLDLELTEPCDLMKPTLCPRYKMPNCCVEPRDPPKCKRPFMGFRCQKRKTKYPSFSECCHEPLPGAPPVECNCLLKPSMCEIWRHYQKKH